MGLGKNAARDNLTFAVGFVSFSLECSADLIGNIMSPFPVNDLPRDDGDFSCSAVVVFTEFDVNVRLVPVDNHLEAMSAATSEL